jgi:hypothetical protein
MIHSSASLALRIQLIQSAPSAITSQVQASETVADFLEILLAIFNLFLRLEMSIDYTPIMFSQFRAFFELFASDLDSVPSVTFLHSLLKISAVEGAVYSRNRQDLRDLINWFAVNKAARLLDDRPTKPSPDNAPVLSLTTAMKIRCLKVLYRISWSDQGGVTFLDQHAVADPALWGGVFDLMAARVRTLDEANIQQQAWNTFRNAVLHQAKFVAFLLGNPDLSAKLGRCFSSIEDYAQYCILSLLPQLVVPLLGGVRKPERLQNLVDLWGKLSDPTVLICGKIRSAVKGSTGSGWAVSGTKAVAIQFIQLLGKATMVAQGTQQVAPLINFARTPHAKEELAEIVSDVVDTSGETESLKELAALLAK